MNCNICGTKVSKEIKVKNRSWEKLYYHCENCDLIFIDQTHILKSDEELERYRSHNNSTEDPVYLAYFEKFISFAFNGLKNISQILDYGSGPEPVLATVLKKQGYFVDIYDKYFSPEKVYKDKKYDMIVSTEVFEHIWDPIPVLKELKMHIKENGYMVIMTNFHTAKKLEFKRWWYIQDPTHISFYSPKTFSYIAKTLDFNIINNNDRNIIVFQKRG